MIIPIWIPVATRWVAAARGTVWKVVTCSHCQQRYAYQLELETTGQVVGPPLTFDTEAAKLAQARAEERLSKMARNVVTPLPCPNCGCYQPDMVERLRTEGTSKAPVIAGLRSRHSRSSHWRLVSPTIGSPRWAGCWSGSG